MTASRSPSRWPAPSAEGPPGSGLAILVNSNAKRGGRRVAVEIGRALPAASVRLTKSAGEIDAWLGALPPPRAVLAAGGDGTAVALLNGLARVTAAGDPLPVFGILPLGTGNGWAHALGAPKLHRCLALLAATTGALPTRRCGAVEVEGTLAHFAGCGWDAMILDDYKNQLAASRGPGYAISKSVYGYVSATLLRTVPRVARNGNPRVTLESLGDALYVVGDDGVPRSVEGARRGQVLYDGPFGTASVGTCPEFGYRFRAFPFAERMPGLFSVRIYQQTALGAVSSIPRLWRGQHPLRGMHNWMADHVRMTFSRPVALEIGGDACGERRTVDYVASKRAVPMVDWRRLQCLADVTG